MNSASLGETRKDTQTLAKTQNNTQTQILAQSFSITPTWVTFITRREQVVGGRWRESEMVRGEVSALLDPLALVLWEGVCTFRHSYTSPHIHPNIHAGRINMT